MLVHSDRAARRESNVENSTLVITSRGLNTTVRRQLQMTPSLVRRLERDYSQVLTAIFTFMLDSGMTSTNLRIVCARSIDKAERRARLGHKEDADELVAASMALDTWHRNRRYLNEKAAPRPVRLLGRAPSVEALIRLQRRGEDAAKVARRLKAFHLVVPCGNSLYRPRSDAAVVSRHDPLVLQHAARALSTLLETVTQNMSVSRSSPMIERTAEVPDLPSEHVEAFKRFSQVQGRLLLRTVNDWLESRRSRSFPRGRSSVRAGVHVHAFVGKQGRPRKTKT
jgi:hypothetical protein